MLSALMLAAALVHPVEPATAGGTLSDGDRYAAWTNGAQVRVLDEQTGVTASVALAPGCRAPDALGAGALAFVCGKGFKTFDVASGVWSDVPATPEVVGMFNADAVSVEAIGRTWLQVALDLGYHSPTDPVWVERATGRVVGKDPGDLSKHADLDDAALFVPFCKPLRRRRNPDYDALTDPTRYLGPTVFGDRAIDFRGDALILRRCGSARSTVLTRAKDWKAAWIGRGRVSWVDQDDVRAIVGDPRGRARVWTYDIATGRRRHWTVPGPLSANVDVVSTRAHLFIDAQTSNPVLRRYAVELATGA
jgi:hypothetical protein